MPPPPRVAFRKDGELESTDYYEPDSPWVEGGFPWLECHRGQLWLFMPPSHDPGSWCFAHFCYLTRGPWQGPEGEERLELYFPNGMRADRAVLQLRPWQCNRLPGWKPGQRCWRIHVMRFDGSRTSRWVVLLWRTTFWRQAQLPCLQGWDGPRPDGLFAGAKGLPFTKDEKRAMEDSLHELNGTYARKKGERLKEDWLGILYRRYGGTSSDVPY